MSAAAAPTARAHPSAAALTRPLPPSRCLTPCVPQALVRRAKAYEQLGQHKLALADMQRANRLDAATEDTRESERRLRDAVAGKKPAGMSGGLAPRGSGAKASAVPSKASASGRQVVFPAKLSMGDDTRVLQASERLGRRMGSSVAPPAWQGSVGRAGQRQEGPCCELAGSRGGALERDMLPPCCRQSRRCLTCGSMPLYCPAAAGAWCHLP